MFDSIRRHQKWLWIVIMTVTIISFVAFFSPTQQTGGGFRVSGSDKVGTIDGEPLSRDEFINAYREAELRYLFSRNEWPRNNQMATALLEQETRTRLLLIKRLQDLDFKISEAATAKWIIESFTDPETKSFRKDAYDQFKAGLPIQGLSIRDFERFVRHEIGIQHLISVAGVSGRLVTPQEVESQFRTENEQVDTQIVMFSRSNYLDKVTIEPAALGTYFTNNLAEYRIPERVQVHYVVFPATNYLAEADQAMTTDTNVNTRIDSIYQQRGTNSFTDASNQPLPPEAAKAKIRSELRQSYAVAQARRKAVEFANELIEMPPQPDNLSKLAAAKGFSTDITPPFTQRDGPTNLRVPATFAQAAFKLTPEEPLHEQPISGQDAVYLISLAKRIPSEPPPLDSVRQRVEEDFRRAKATELLNAAGEQFRATLANAVAQGKSFDSAAAEAQLVVVDLPPFSRKTTTLPELANRSDLPTLQDAAYNLTTSQVSRFIPTRTGGYIVFLQGKIPVAADKLQKELPEFADDLRRRKQFEAFTEWLRKEMEIAKITLPGDEQTPQAAN